MSLIFLLILLSVFLCGIAIALRGRQGMPLLTEPRCAKCNYDLRGFSGTAPVRCSECGADLTARHAILWGTYQRTRGRIWIAIAVGLLPIIILPLLLFGMRVGSRSSAVFPGSPAFSARSNAAVITSLATSANTPWDWQELEKRLAAGSLTNAEVTQAIDSLIAFLKTQPTNQPLSWSDQFLTRADAAGKITDEQYQRLAKAFYKSTKVSIVGTLRSGAKLPVVVESGGPWQLPGVDFVYALRQVSISGGSTLAVASIRQGNRETPNADYLSAKSPQRIDGTTKLAVPPGDYVLTFSVDVGLLHEKTAPQIVDELPGQASRWPNGRGAWTDVLTVPIKVVAADQSPIALVTDPGLDPQKNRAIASSPLDN